MAAMTNIGQIAQHIGMHDRDGERAVVMSIVKSDKVRHDYLSDVANAELDPRINAVYLASGLFRDGSLVGNRGRSAENLTRVVWLPFDADLLDYLGAPNGSDPDAKAKRAAMLEELGATPQDEIDQLVAALREDLESTFAAGKIPIHRLDYTGYGLCAYVYLDDASQVRITEARAFHKHLVDGINKHFGDHLVDPQCSDAGTRVTRIPESINHKGSVPRLVQTLAPYTGGSVAIPETFAPIVRPVATYVAREGAALSAEDAKALVEALAPSWLPGQRHAVALAVCGMLAKAGIPESQADAIIEALGDDPDYRRKSVEATYRRVRAGGSIAGYSQLATLLPTATVQFVDTMLSRYRDAATPRSGAVTMGAFDVVGSASRNDATKTNVFEPTPLPAAARTGWVSDYVDLVEPTTESPDAYHLACGLTLIGACIGRRISLYHASERMFPNFYTLLIGPSGGARKDSAIRRSLALAMCPPPPGSQMMTLGIPWAMLRNISSAEGLIGKLATHNNRLFYEVEFSKLMHNATRESTNSISPTLIEAFDGPPTIENTVKKAENSLIASNPFLSILTSVQPEILAELIGETQQYSGFLNRWLLVIGRGKGPRPNPPNLDEVAGWALMKRAMDAIQSYPEGQALGFDPDAAKRWEDWYVSAYPSGDASAQEDAMGIRLGTLIKKTALIHAVLKRAPRITTDELDPAIAFIDWTWAETRKLLPSWGEAPDAKLQRKIVEVLSKRGGMMPKRDVQMRAGCRSGPGVFARIVKSMVENGELVLTADNQIGVAP